MIADAGRGTLDITSYEVTRTAPLQLKELTSSDCMPSLNSEMPISTEMPRPLRGGPIY